METKSLHSGKLRLITYDPAKRLLHVELENGTAFDYDNVDRETWRRFSTSGVAWSFYRDNIEEEFHGTRGRATPRQKPAGLDELFGSPPGDSDT